MDDTLAVKNAGDIEIKYNEEPYDKPYKLRQLTAMDMGIICKIITLIGIRQFKECFDMKSMEGLLDVEDTEDMGEKAIEKIGFSVVFDIAGIILSNIPKAETEIQMFLASLTGMEVSQLRQIPFADYGELIVDVLTKREFRDFFKRVMKLFGL